MEKKSLERIFQEKFKDFEVNPPESSWNEISKRLEDKKKRRLVPAWWWLGGAAALFIIGMLGFQFINKPLNSLEELENIDPNTNPKNIPIVLEPFEEEKTTSAADPLTIDLDENAGSGSSKAVVVDANSGSTQQNKTSSSRDRNPFSNSKTDFQDEKSASTPMNNSSQAMNNTIPESSEKKSFDLNQGVAFDNIKSTNTKNITSIDSVLSLPLEVAVELPKERNALEELLLEKEKEQKLEESKRNRWLVSTALAPVFFNSNNGNSTLDPMLDYNPKEFESNVSYGVGVQYEVNSRLAVRSGVNVVNMGLNTNNVMFYPDLTGIGLQNIRPGEGTVMMVIPRPDKSNMSLLVPNSFGSTQNPGQLNQRLGFIEVPMELSYKIINKKMGIQVIGGMSTFFLTDNQVRIIGDEFSMLMGEANNINPVHFSTNIGLGVDYQFLKSFRASVEPMFKYQLNTFSNNSGNFRPYFIGIYSGISYQF